MRAWQIIPQSNAPQVTFAVKELAAAIREYSGKDADFGDLSSQKNHIFLRTDETLPAHSLHVNVCAPKNDIQDVYILGTDSNALLYGCMDFVNIYLPISVQTRNNGSYFKKLFADEPLPEKSYTKIPAIKHRGLWTWGLAVYDYRGYLENMARLKLNEVIFWNDYPPINGREIVEYAHNLGIKVIWGYAWGWDTTMKLDDSDEAAERIAEEYENRYSSLGGDGIYFQSFTETTEETLGGKLIAEAVVDFVNRISARILDKHPNLLLQFGLHANSVKNRMSYIAGVDPRVHIIWENCGDFPYHYIPGVVSNRDETEEMTRKILDLRPGTTTGAVIKGMINLNWHEFSHQTGPSMLGCAAPETLEKRLREVKPIWHFFQAEWMKHGDNCRRVIDLFTSQESELYGLIEDGAFEKEIPLPAALYSEMLWDSKRPFDELLYETASRRDVHFS